MLKKLLPLGALILLAGCASLAEPGGPFAPRTTLAAQPAQPSQTQLITELKEAERLLAAGANTASPAAAFSDALDPTEGFVIRQGQLMQGPSEVMSGLRQPANAGAVYWQPERAFVSKSGDMGMTSGRFVQVLRGQEAQEGRYVSVWRRDETGRWKLLSDVAVLDPPRTTRR